MKNLNDINDWLDTQEHLMIGEILVQCGKVDLKALGVALDVQHFEKLRLGDILVRMKVVTEDELEQALQLQKRLDEIIEERGN